MNNKTILTNFKIIQRQDKNNQDYYIIFDNDKGENNAYFCWQGTVKTGWDSLKNYQNLKEVEIEWQFNERGNKVINIFANSENELFI